MFVLVHQLITVTSITISQTSVRHLAFHSSLVKTWVSRLGHVMFCSLVSRLSVAMGYKTWALAVQGWADEKNDFVFGSGVQPGVVGHYTQVDLLITSARSS